MSLNAPVAALEPRQNGPLTCATKMTTVLVLRAPSVMTVNMRLIEPTCSMTL